jgi:hypothetical protein
MCGETAFYLAVENGKLEILEYLEEKLSNLWVCPSALGSHWD